ncbi:hypothetical protein PVA45_08530 (plasmid) [Entomospira entomophila]|nr:DNA methyltransferase [Entomospira entomophilus]WDI36457.1 hypothetical protein PVA45_08530 [Entomospira entomophilus]
MADSGVDFSRVIELLGDEWLDSGIEITDQISFRKKFREFFSKLQEAKATDATEQTIVNVIKDLMKDGIAENQGYIDSNQENNYDLVVRSAEKNIVTLIECKKIKGKQLSTYEDLNKKSLQQLIYYFLKENLDNHGSFRKSLYLKRLVISDGLTWLVWRADHFFALVKDKFNYNGNLVRLNKVYTEFKKSEDNYPAIKTYIEEEDKNREDKFRDKCYTLDLNNLVIDNLDEKEWKILYHFFSGSFWLARDTYYDPNTLHEGFYKELLHIMGLQEVVQDGLKIIIPDPSITNSIYNIIQKKLDAPATKKMNEYVFELMILWINRILFLKLFEAHIINVRASKENKNNRSNYEFMSFKPDQITSWHDLNDLFFEVLAKNEHERGLLRRKCFEHIPYLNSALFMRRDVMNKDLGRENETVLMDDIGLMRDDPLALYKDSVLTREKNPLPLLEYLLKFLSAYDFGSDGQAKKHQGSKKIEDKLINASVLGKVFEKLNGYKDGSFFTPSFITTYICRESIHQALVGRVNATIKEPYFKSYDDLLLEYQMDMSKNAKDKVREIIRSLTILDPAVGSGHFLVSALNEMLNIRYDFNMFEKLGEDKTFSLEVINDEIMVSDTSNDKPVWYTVHDLKTQIFQRELFHTKQEIIENNLFGVDINPNSVEICRLRLWIELLKSSYYLVPKEQKQVLGEKLQDTVEYVPMETLPNIDINIKVGNSLLYSIDLTDKKNTDGSSNITQDQAKEGITKYARLTQEYKHVKDKERRKSILKKKY